VGSEQSESASKHRHTEHHARINAKTTKHCLVFYVTQNAK